MGDVVGDFCHLILCVILESSQNVLAGSSRERCDIQSFSLSQTRISIEGAVHPPQNKLES